MMVAWVLIVRRAWVPASDDFHASQSPVRAANTETTAPLTRDGRPPKLPKADDELTRELRRLIGPEQHQAELYLGHPTEELSELLLDMSFLSQEALEDSEISGIIEGEVSDVFGARVKVNTRSP